MTNDNITLTSHDLQQFINAYSVQGEILHLPVKTLTVADAAEALCVEPEQIIKSVLFLADGEPVLIISGGTKRIAWKQLADYLGVSRRRLKSAKPEQVLAITGFVVGSVPPFGHRGKLRTIVETAVMQQATIYGGGGDIDALLKLSVDELQRVVGKETAVLAES